MANSSSGSRSPGSRPGSAPLAKHPPIRVEGRPPNPDDVAIGARVRARRNQLGMSQGELGQALGVTFQQIQKYEGGKNRIGGSRMLAIAKALDCPVASFFGAGDDPLGEISGFDRADLEFARAAARLPAKIKQKMLAIVSVVADAAAAGVKLPGLALVAPPMPGDDFSKLRNGESPPPTRSGARQ